MDTWNLLVELKGISHTLAFLSRLSYTSPIAISVYFNKAASDASPYTSRSMMGTWSWFGLNSARLHNTATRTSLIQVGEGAKSLF
ncbi:hypothetical protein Pmani_035337 [Petrolisthes manimaculis]|uniref:Uncharacterized protein n=1 Tax=Petrolisthes manimaculis TaxID=1843537 RepID=A0AAE1TNA9_9EUCA|nr:hypothetical protein Pmani_035337 [Petrolisthes manimaculis]